MPKKKRSTKRGGQDSDEDDGASTTSAYTTSTIDVLAEEDKDSPFELHIDALYEKRSATREKALQGLAMLMMTSYCYDDCIERIETLTSLLQTSVKRGASVEAALAAKCLALLVLQIGAGPDALELYRSSAPVLRKGMTGSSSVGVRSACFDTLAMLAFVALDDPEVVVASMVPFSSAVANHSAAGVTASAVRGWALLLSVLPQSMISPEWVEEHLDMLARCLASDSVDVRTAAGQAVALLYHSAGLVDEEDEEEDEEDHADGCSTSGSSLAPGMDDIVTRMQALATNRGDAMRRSRRDRAHLSGTFRRLCRSVVDGDVPTVKIKLRYGDVLVVDTLAGHVQLAALKQHLADGFQVHLLRNPLLHEIFDYEPTEEPPERMSAMEKRMYRSPGSESSKARTQRRSKARAAGARGMAHVAEW